MPQDIFDYGFDGFINNNGGMCSDEKGKTFFVDYIDSADVEAILAYDEKEPFAFSYMTETSFSINRVNENVEKAFAYFGMKVPKVVEPRELRTDNIMQMNFFVNEEQETILMNTVLKKSTSSRWIEYFADVNPENVNKMFGIKRMCDYYSLDLAKTMAFGDGGNDSEMLKGCTIGVAMGNANREVKEVADYVTTSADDDGIWNALKHYQII